MKEQSPISNTNDFKVGFETYLSPFSYRYGSEYMRRIWSQETLWGTCRDIWIATAETQQEAGIIKQTQVDNLKQNKHLLSVERIFQLEKETGHDVAGAIAEYSEIAPEGGAIIHQGMTSEDVFSNAEVIQIHESFKLIRSKLTGTLDGFAQRILEHKDFVCMGYTHLQAAEPTTMGYRFAKYAQDLLIDLKLLDSIQPMIKGKGIKGAVGTSASFEEVLKNTGMTVEEHEKRIMEKLGIEAFTITDQTTPRKSLHLTENVLSNIGQSLHRFALDMQILQSSFSGEVSEPRSQKQVGSSAMPWKQNPINAENIDSITEILPGQSFAAWMTAAFVTLERTLRDSAGKRSWLPESFLIVDETLTRAEKVIRGLVIHENAIKTNLARFAPFSATEIILVRLTKAGLDRKIAHEIIRDHAETAVETVRSGLPNPIKELLVNDENITSILGKGKVEQAFEEIYHHIGNIPKKCVDFVNNELYPAISS